MNEQLPERQQKILAFIGTYQEQNGFPPTVREIGENVGIKSTSLVSYYLDGLQKRGLLERQADTSRGIRLTAPLHAAYAPATHDTLAIPFLGYIVASAPIPVEPLSGAETVEINRALFGRDSSDLFALKVKGNSMIDALVHDGDTIILRHQERVENGEMAAVWISGGPGETTLKKIYYEGKQVRLQPANPTMHPIYVPTADVQVQGKVVLVIRQL